MSSLTHIVTVTSASGSRVNPLTFGSPGFRECHGLVDLAARLAAAARNPDLRVTVERLPGWAPARLRRSR
jgi:hypothetical protein